MAEQLFQIGVKALVRNSAGEILLTGHQSPDGTSWRYDLPGGRMDVGETFTDTLQRELREELGLYNFEQGDLIGITQARTSILVGDVHIPLVLVVYGVGIDPNAKLKAGGGEAVFEWLPPPQAYKLMASKYPQSFLAQLR